MIDPRFKLLLKAWKRSRIQARLLRRKLPRLQEVVDRVKEKLDD